ncbi:hypothetical protein [Vibrio sp. F74]|uniref:hypothetical protein n=1 Tax=Vibrio sp. F74 TaxID=700020 RepID=UPI0035F5BE39
MNVKTLVLLVGLLSCSMATASDETYLKLDIPFNQSTDSKSEAEAWGMCGSAYAFGMYLVQGNDSLVQRYARSSRGARIASIMSNFKRSMIEQGIDGADMPNTDSELWKKSRKFGNTLFADQTSILMTDAQVDRESLNTKLLNTLSQCDQNVDSQNYYVNFWHYYATISLLAD